MIQVNMDVKGLKDLNEALLKLPLQVRQRPLRSAAAAAAKVIRDEARNRAPVDSGVLRSEIVHTRSKSESREGSEVWYVTVRFKKKKYVNSVGNRLLDRVGKSYGADGNAYYWKFLEFGSSKQRPKPFLRPAFDGSRTQALEMFKKRLAQSIARIARKFS